MNCRLLKQLVAIIAWQCVSSSHFLSGPLDTMNDYILKNKYHCTFLFRKRYGERIDYQGDICKCDKPNDWMFVGAILKEDLDKLPPKSEFRKYKIGAFGEKKLICEDTLLVHRSNGVNWYTDLVPGFGYFFAFKDVTSTTTGPSLLIGLGTQDRTDFETYPSTFDTRDMNNKETYLAVWCCPDVTRPLPKPTTVPSRKTTSRPSLKTSPAPAMTTTYAPSLKQSAMFET